MPAILEYPLQGLNRLAPLLLGAGGLVASPESSLDEIASLVASSGLPVEVFGFGRQQLLLSRDELGRQEGLVSLADDSRVAQELSLVDAKGFVFPVAVSRGETRLSNARVTNLAPAAAELARAGVRGFIVEQRELEPSRAWRPFALAGSTAWRPRPPASAPRPATSSAASRRASAAAGGAVSATPSAGFRAASAAPDVRPQPRSGGP